MNGIKRTPAQIERRQEICKDLLIVCQQDEQLLEELIDEYVYTLSEQQVDEIEDIIVNQYGYN